VRLGRPVRLADQLPAGSWAMAMGCGIVSIDLFLEGWLVPSDVMLWLAVVAWAVLVVRWAAAPACAVREASSPPALGSVAATTVLGARFAVGLDWVGAAFLVPAALGLAVLLWPVVKNWTTPAAGTSFLVSVAIQGVAALSATLAVSYRADWLLYAAMALFLVGLAAYAVILWRFDFRSVGTGAGDQWVVGGALAIGTLAAGKIAVADAAGAWTGLLDDLALALWCVAMAWLIPLVISEVIRPRLRYHVLRWATVFPVGMYAACSFAVGQVTGLGGITDFARIWTPIAVAVTLIVLIGLTRRVLNDRDVADRDVADRDVADRDVAHRVMPDRVRDGQEGKS
jgi:tellurite resistance protein TehA-like permease